MKRLEQLRMILWVILSLSVPALMGLILSAPL